MCAATTPLSPLSSTSGRPANSSQSVSTTFPPSCLHALWCSFAKDGLRRRSLSRLCVAVFVCPSSHRWVSTCSTGVPVIFNVFLDVTEVICYVGCKCFGRWVVYLSFHGMTGKGFYQSTTPSFLTYIVMQSSHVCFFMLFII